MPTEDQRPAKVCEICKEKPTIHPNSRYCASCMARRSHKKKTAKETPKRTSPAQPPRPDRELSLTVNFGKHGDILEQIERLADEELRPVEMEIIYLLKQHLNAVQGGVEVG